jgi:hypothetical protein
MVFERPYLIRITLGFTPPGATLQELAECMQQ